MIFSRFHCFQPFGNVGLACFCLVSTVYIQNEAFSSVHQDLIVKFTSKWPKSYSLLYKMYSLFFIISNIESN